MFFIFLIVVILTAIALVVAAMTIAKLVAPRSFNPQKGEPYECGIPTRGESWVRFRAGYYLFAILFLIFDIETVFLFPWAVVVSDAGMYALMAERSVGMEIKKRTQIRSMEYDEFRNNDYLERMVKQLNADGAGIIVGTADELINWGRSNSLWSLTFGTSCCAIEFMALGAARYDMARFGFEVTRNSPRQADMIMVLGTITYRMAPVLKRLYDQMAEPKYVVAVGGCTISGGPFRKSYHVVNGIDKIIPVDVFIPGCPPRPEAFYYGMMQLQRKIKVERFLGGVNRKESKPEFEKSEKLKEDK